MQSEVITRRSLLSHSVSMMRALLASHEWLMAVSYIRNGVSAKFTTRCGKMHRRRLAEMICLHYAILCNAADEERRIFVDCASPVGKEPLVKM
jgi:hypothetical protein